MYLKVLKMDYSIKFNNREYAVCTNCIMDTSDPIIKFDQNGVCNYCNNYYQNIEPNWLQNINNPKIIEKIISNIKKNKTKNSKYDCLIGISGGLDSSYVAHIAVKKFNLNPLLFHCDAGWNSDISTNNIEKLVSNLNCDLHTEVINWKHLKDLQRSFFYSQVPFVDQPVDLVLFSSLYNFAAKNNFKYIITGGNNSTECVRECIDWTYFSTDTKHVRDIHKKFGKISQLSLPMCDIFKYKFYYRFIKQIKVIKLLDYLPFIKENAEKTLNESYGWKPYQMKHYESRFTKFYESFWTPKKHGYDKRRAYLSSLILTKQLRRDQALIRISQNELTDEEMNKDFKYVAKKLDFTESEFLEIFNGKNKSFRDYKNRYNLIMFFAKVANIIGIEKRLFN